jgi:tRNA1(Val) A37 N6-methylase TrmN6
LYSVDDFLGGLVRLKQPKKGLRATSDTVLLAASVPNGATGSLLDMGCGSGIIALSIAKRAKGITALGVDIQEELINLAKENAALNGLSEKAEFQKADIKEKGLLKGVMFDYVVTNPPFYSESAEYTDTPLTKAVAHHEKNENFLAVWVDFAIKHLKPKGKFIMLHKADRLDDVLSLMSGRLGALTVKPLYSREDKPASRIIVSGVMNSKKALSIEPALIVHNADGSFTEQAESILRGKSLL